MKKFLTLLNYLFAKTYKAQCLIILVFAALAILNNFIFKGISGFGKVLFSVAIIVSSLTCAATFYRQNSRGGNKYVYKTNCSATNVYMSHVLTVITYAVIIWLFQLVIGAFIAPNAQKIEFLFNRANEFYVLPFDKMSVITIIYHIIGFPVILTSLGLSFAKKSGRFMAVLAALGYLLIYLYTPHIESILFVSIVMSTAIVFAVCSSYKAIKEEEYDS